MSVLLVAGDSAEHLATALASIESQVLESTIEVVVVDRSADDRTASVVAAWSRRVGIPAHVQPSGADEEPELALHRGLVACCGAYVALLDAGDEWLSVDALQQRVRLLDEHPGLSMAATRTLVVDSTTGGSRTVPALDAQLPEGGATAADLADGGWPVTSSSVVYRSEVLHRLDPGVFETSACRRLLDLATTAYGPVGLVPDVATSHRVHPGGGPGPDQDGAPLDARALLPEHGHLLGPAVLRQLRGDAALDPVADRTGSAAVPTAVPDAATAGGRTPGARRGVVVLDDYFPTKGTGFRIAEFDWMLRQGVVAEVMTTVPDLPSLLTEYATLHPETHRQVSSYDARRLGDFECASVMFLNNAAHFVADLERAGLPFVLTLYPGGGLNPGTPRTERMLRRVLASPMLEHVITTQPVVTELIRSSSDVPVTEVLGVTVDPGYLRPGPGLRTDHFGTGKPVLDVCFVAHRYTADGSDKGWPVFLQTLRLLTDAGLPVRGHVVGGFGPADVDAEHAHLPLTFASTLSTPELRAFYAGMDVVLSPTAAGRLAPGAFDGFPTGACVEAALCGVALVATDPLGQNRLFTDGHDIHMPPADPVEVAQRVLDMVAEPGGLQRVAQAGLRTARRAYGVDAQLWTRRRILEAARTPERAQTTAVRADPLVSVLVPTYNGERFLRAALRSALGQSHRNIEVLVGDDGSTDRTPEILRAVAAEDPRVRVLRFDPNVGPLENPRRLLAEARGEYVKFLMHDDVLATDCVRELVRGMESYPEATLAFSQRVLIDEDGRPVPGHEFAKVADRPGLIEGRPLGDHVLVNCANVIGEPTTVLFRREDVAPEDLWLVDGRTVDVLNDVQLWLKLLAEGPAFYTPNTLSRFRQHAGQNSHNPRYVGRGERDWARLIDWGARNGFLLDAGQQRRAQARALLEAAARLHSLIDTPDHGAALEAAYLSTAALVELTRPTAGTPTQGLPERAHGAAVREHLAQELDVWTRAHPVALAVPALDQAEVDATVQALREVLAAGVAELAVVAVPPADLEAAIPLLETALAAGPDIDVELVPSDAPAMMFTGPWLAVVPHGGRWHESRSIATWTFDPAGHTAGPAAGAVEVPPLTRRGLAECREVLAGVQEEIGDPSAMWTALVDAQFRRSGRRTELLTTVGEEFIRDFERRRADVPADRPFFTGTHAGGVRFLGDARDWPSALHAVDPGCNSILIDALRAELSRRPGDFVDVGTNIGVLAVSIAAHLAPGGQVLAFEPSPDTARLAAATIALNDADNVTLLDAAVSDADGSLSFNTTPGNSAIASARRHQFGLLNEWESVTVPAVRLDTLHAAGELDGVSVVKIDVEGHELGVLRGALGFIAAVRPTVVFEYTPVAAADHGWTQEDAVALLRRAGEFEFTALSESDGGVLPFPLPAGHSGQVNVFARPVGQG
ncbi:FkbM family methyltransferase [Modestobacter sp. VKM Ac-2986]|uniref:FkbM family methyltransferase n=1 Tax=Modestobacter sp. VKM Ac-2986 TaxID=3004140 RepID=UPI0022AB582E|nr:FkbM family methyltransferase [Modestobacter sp. VKM Ac-2986]MCZ2830305.1 FkbM family methyltransferase [Modestobacter sp. VKM Ac-2986]